jgi:hypothetical protein
MGPVIGLTLRLRRALPLHASAVVIGDQAVTLAGGPGAGKSTTAAGFAKLGDGVLSDDVAALREEGGKFIVQPGYPRINLWPDSARSLFGSEESLSRISPTWEKRFMALDQSGLRFEQRPLELGAIYVLGERKSDSSTPIIEEMEGSAALLSLVANTYMNYVIDPEMRREEFSALGRVLARVPVRFVRAPTDPSCLGNLCEAIRADVKKSQTTASFSARRGHS